MKQYDIGFKEGQKELLTDLLEIYNGESYYVLEAEMQERLKVLSNN